MTTDRLQRLESEKTFHNNRFSEEVREAQGKYYACIKHGAARFDSRVQALAINANVLEYGCGAAFQGIELARVAKTLTGIDISDVAIADARRESARAGQTNTDYQVMDAEDMTFPDATFDLVFGRGIIHHLDLERCFASVSRVLRPGGTALFWEPLGHNRILNAYRDRTPEARTPDEHPLLKSDFALAQRRFEVTASFSGLSTIVTVPIRDTSLGDALLAITAKVDDLLFLTPARWYAWYCMMELRKPLAN